MVHIVKCRYCKESFDTDKNEYVESPKGWYYHTNCYELKKKEEAEKEQAAAEKAAQKLAAKEAIKEAEKTIPKANLKKCYYCNMPINIAEEEYGKPVVNRYAHKACMEKHYVQGETEYIDAIYALLKDRVHMAYNYQVCEKQRANYIKQGYNNKGIYQALEYWYVIKKNSIEKANGAIGIVPYIYADAQHYYEELEKKQKAINKSLQKGLAKEHIKITITEPETIKQRELIDLDDIFKEEGEEDWQIKKLYFKYCVV